MQCSLSVVSFVRREEDGWGRNQLGLKVGGVRLGNLSTGVVVSDVCVVKKEGCLVQLPKLSHSICDK